MKVIKMAVAALFISATPFAQADDGVLTGVVRLSCEAILCLSTGSPPNECSPSLIHYFDIDFSSLSKTIRERKKFLNLCPVASQTPEMKSLVNAIANGGGRCDAASLNATLVSYVSGVNGLQGCIKDTKPSYCTAYEGHEYTRITGAQYVIDPPQNQFWPFANAFGNNSIGMGFAGIGNQGQSQTCGHWVDSQAVTQ